MKAKINLKKKGERYSYKEQSLIFDRKATEVSVRKGSWIIEPDKSGADLIYFGLKEQRLLITPRFRDFLGTPLNEEFLMFLKQKGYVPFPFTILRGVYKAPPGVRTIIRQGKQGLEWRFEAEGMLDDFNSNSIAPDKFMKLFRQELHKSAPPKLVCSYSGGFDSRLLSEEFRDNIFAMVHFDEGKNIKIPKGIMSIIIGNHEPYSQKDLAGYFQAVDEPNCDHVAFAEYLMLRALKRKKMLKGMPVMNGQGMDGLFANGRFYYQVGLAARLGNPLSDAKIFQDHRSSGKLYSRIGNYFLGVKARFIKEFLPRYGISDKSYSVLLDLLDLYMNNIRNDDVNKAAALVFMLYYPLHGIEKIKQASRATGMKYFLPFMSEGFVRLAFSIPAEKKTGLIRGKRILRRHYPHISFKDSGGFDPAILKARIIGRKGALPEYHRYFLERWREENRIRW